MTAVADQNLVPVLSPYASPEFNESFWHELKYLAHDVAATLGEDLIAVVLGGGFGRSEGCSVEVDGYEMPYNDVDLFLITRVAKLRKTNQLAALAHRYENRLKIAVDFSRPQTPAMIRKWQPLLMWQELVLGHIVLYGPQDILTSNASPVLLHPLPVVEASRLLLNRGAGLLWAARVSLGLDAPPDGSFVVRNYFKCGQALADALLIAGGCYLSDPAEKAVRLQEVLRGKAGLEAFRIGDLFAESQRFRRNPGTPEEVPFRKIRDMAQAWIAVFLWIESQRHGQLFPDAASYAGWPHRRERGLDPVWQLLATNLRRRTFGWQHPRELVYESLPGALEAMVLRPDQAAASSAAALEIWKRAQ